MSAIKPIEEDELCYSTMATQILDMTMLTNHAAIRNFVDTLRLVMYNTNLLCNAPDIDKKTKLALKEYEDRVGRLKATLITEECRLQLDFKTITDKLQKCIHNQRKEKSIKK